MTLIVALVIMFRENWILALVGAAVVPLFAIPTRRAGKTRWAITKESQACSDEINGILNETLSVSGQLLVKLFGMEEREYQRYETVNRNMIRLNIKESMAGRWFRMALNTFTNIGPMLIYLVGGIIMMRYDDTVTVGQITVLVALLGKMYMPVNQLLNIQVDWIRSMAMFTRIFEYYDMKPEIENAPDAVTPETVSGEVEFQDVRFYYEPEREILKNITFRLETGKCIAIVGPSGSGKSTLINLIPRLYDVIDGKVLFDGMDVRQLDLAFLRKKNKFGKIGCLGHSEGGAIAFMLAARGQTDFIISLAGPGVKGDTLLVAQSNRILELSGGLIECHSQPGQGTEMAVALPLDSGKTCLLQLPEKSQAKVT